MKLTKLFTVLMIASLLAPTAIHAMETEAACERQETIDTDKNADYTRIITATCVACLVAYCIYRIYHIRLMQLDFIADQKKFQQELDARYAKIKKTSDEMSAKIAEFLQNHVQLKKSV